MSADFAVVNDGGRLWGPQQDTTLPAPRDFTPGGNDGITGSSYGLAAYSSVILVTSAQ